MLGFRGDGVVVMSEALNLSDFGSFRPVDFLTGQIHVKGGCLRKHVPMQTKSVGLGSRKITFVKLATSEEWLIQATCGTTQHRSSSFGRTSLLETMREFIQLVCNGTIKPPEVDEALDADDHDPMDDIAVSDDDGPSSAVVYRDRKRTRYRKPKRVVSNKVVEMEVNNDPPELQGHPGYCAGTKVVKLFIVDRKQIWLEFSEVAWAVRYLWLQNVLKGVPFVGPDDAGPSGPPSGQCHGDGEA